MKTIIRKHLAVLYCLFTIVLTAKAQPHICGAKFNDLNRDGFKDLSEPLMPGWRIELWQNGMLLDWRITDAGGSYCFNNLPPGTYQVKEVQQPGWVQSAPGGGAAGFVVDIPPGSTIVWIVYFGNYCDTDYDLRYYFLNSGTDESGNPIPGLITGSTIPKWTVISDPDSFTTEPRAAQHIASPYPPGWLGPISYPLFPTPYTSEWMTAYNTSSNNINGTYVFQTCFCLESGFTNASLNLHLRADDEADVYLNGALIGSTPPGSFALPETVITETDQSKFHAGENCIEIHVRNVNSFYMGVNVAGLIAAGSSGDHQLATECCHVQPLAPMVSTGFKETDQPKGMITQNVPNPFSTETSFNYALFIASKQARLEVYDLKGQLMKRIDLKEKEGAVTLHTEGWKDGTYIYKLIADENVIDTKKMILVK